MCSVKTFQVRTRGAAQHSIAQHKAHLRSTMTCCMEGPGTILSSVVCADLRAVAMLVDISITASPARLNMRSNSPPRFCMHNKTHVYMHVTCVLWQCRWTS